MNDVARLVLEAWQKLSPKIIADSDELNRRLARRRMKILTRPPRAWCLGIRASRLQSVTKGDATSPPLPGGCGGTAPRLRDIKKIPNPVHPNSCKKRRTPEPPLQIPRQLSSPPTTKMRSEPDHSVIETTVASAPRPFSSSYLCPSVPHRWLNPISICVHLR